MDELADLAASVAAAVSEAGGEVVETVIAAGAEAAGAAMEIAAQALTPLAPPRTTELPDLTKASPALPPEKKARGEAPR